MVHRIWSHDESGKELREYWELKNSKCNYESGSSNIICEDSETLKGIFGEESLCLVEVPSALSEGSEGHLEGHVRVKTKSKIIYIPYLQNRAYLFIIFW